MSLGNQGVFQLMKKETQLAIAREDWTTDGSLVNHIVPFIFSAAFLWDDMLSLSEVC